MFAERGKLLAENKCAMSFLIQETAPPTLAAFAASKTISANSDTTRSRFALELYHYFLLLPLTHLLFSEETSSCICFFVVLLRKIKKLNLSFFQRTKMS